VRHEAGWSAGSAEYRDVKREADLPATKPVARLEAERCLVLRVVEEARRLAELLDVGPGVRHRERGEEVWKRLRLVPVGVVRAGVVARSAKAIRIVRKRSWGAARSSFHLEQLRLHADEGHARDGHRRQELLSDAFDSEEGKCCGGERSWSACGGVLPGGWNRSPSMRPAKLSVFWKMPGDSVAA